MEGGKWVLNTFARRDEFTESLKCCVLLPNVSRNCMRQVIPGKTMKALSFVATVGLLILSIPYFPLRADDSAVEVTPKGLKFKASKHIIVQREDLSVSLDRVTVSMTFKNLSDSDIVTDVAFPIPSYGYSEDYKYTGAPDFGDFSVEVNGKSIPHQTEVRAYANGKECTRILNKYHVSISDFERYNPSDSVPSYFTRLPRDGQELFIKERLVDTSAPYPIGFPKWTVSIKYFWRQVFPANDTVTIRHQYKPVSGYTPFSPVDLGNELCLSRHAKRIINAAFEKREGTGGMCWVSYVLKSALNWKHPIQRFHLIIDGSDSRLVSTCFKAKFKELSENRLELSVDNYVPESNIKVFFFRF